MLCVECGLNTACHAGGRGFESLPDRTECCSIYVGQLFLFGCMVSADVEIELAVVIEGLDRLSRVFAKVEGSSPLRITFSFFTTIIIQLFIPNQPVFTKSSSYD